MTTVSSTRHEWITSTSADPVADHENNHDACDAKFGAMMKVFERFDAQIQALGKQQAKDTEEIEELKKSRNGSSALFSALQKELDTLPDIETKAVQPATAASNAKPASDESAGLTALAKELKTFQSIFAGFQLVQQRRSEQDKRIDDASDAHTKDALHDILKTLNTAIFDNGGKDATKTFRGGEEELIQLRSRVIRRLALFDFVGEALEDFRKAEEEASVPVGAQGSFEQRW
jgi:hypothetical protein